MSGNHSKVMMVGLVSSGKTTFLAALWHIVQAQGLRRLLTLKRLEGDRTHLNQIRDAWLSCSPLDRTKLQHEELVTLVLEDHTGTEIEVVIPDLSGEVFELQLRERRWSRSFDNMADGAEGILLLIHPDSVRPAHRIDSANRLAEEIESPDYNEEESAPSSQATPWLHDLMPTQVQLVELLQFFLERQEGDGHLRVVVGVSAWDLVEGIVDTPKEFVRSRLPLLWQFLAANDQTIFAIVVGISAQGGDLVRDRDSLLGQNDPSERIRIVGIDCERHDLTAPIAWLLG